MFETIAHPRQRAFLAAFAACGIVKQAAEAAGVSRELHYDWKAQDELYALAFAHAEELAGDVLEDEAVHRATAGIQDVVLHQGLIVTYEELDPETGLQVRKPLFKRRVSDKLLAMLLTGRKPQRYARKTLEHTGEVKHSHAIDFSVYTDEELELIGRLSRKASDARERSDDASLGGLAEAEPDSGSGSDRGGDGTPETP